MIASVPSCASPLLLPPILSSGPPPTINRSEHEAPSKSGGDSLGRDGGWANAIRLPGLVFPQNSSQSCQRIRPIAVRVTVTLGKPAPDSASQYLRKKRKRPRSWPSGLCISFSGAVSFQQPSIFPRFIFPLCARQRAPFPAKFRQDTGQTPAMVQGHAKLIAAGPLSSTWETCARGRAWCGARNAWEMDMSVFQKPCVRPHWSGNDTPPATLGGR